MHLVDGGFEARVGGVEFKGGRFAWEPGFYVREVEGLLDGGDVSSSSVSKPDGDGEYDLPNQRSGPRIITMSGFAWSDSLRELGAMSRQWSGILAADGARGPFVWSEFGEWFTAFVRRGAGSRFVRRGSSGFADFTIRFRAPSQRYYGEVHRFGPASAVEMLHRGNYPAQPEVVVSGPHAGFSLFGPGGRTYRVTQPLTAGEKHEVNMRTGRLSRNGTPVVGWVEAADVWDVPPGSAPVAMQLVGAPSMTVRLFDTYV